jgi:hypothetical protein
MARTSITLPEFANLMHRYLFRASGLLRVWALFIVRHTKGHERTQRFGNWICFHPQMKGGETPTLLGPLERPNLNHWMTQKTTAFRKVDLLPSSDGGGETPTLLGPLERANLNTECYTQPSEHFRIYSLEMFTTYHRTGLKCNNRTSLK